jgi:putative ABC transport system permease protein
MGIILKFIFKSIRERKLRTFLVLFAIALSSALFFASNALSLTMQKMFVESMRTYYGSSNIVILPGPRSEWFLGAARAERHRDELEYVIGGIDGAAVYKPSRNETVDVGLRGFRLEDLDAFSPITFAEKGEMYPFTGKKIIVSQISARQYRWTLGSIIEMELDGAKKRFQVVGIAAPAGLFRGGYDRRVTAVVPISFLASLYGIRGKSTALYLRARDECSIHALITDLSAEYPRFQVREPVSRQEQQQFSSGITTPLLCMTIMVLIMSVFIIYSSFKVITVERLPIIGTFRSIGAARKTTDFVLMVETFLYGVAGGLFGCLLGIGVLYLMSSLMAYNPWADFRMRPEIHFTAMDLGIAFLIAVLLSFVSSLIPIVRVSKLPVKDIVLGRIEAKPKNRRARIILGLCFLSAGMTAAVLVPKAIAVYVIGASSVLIASAIILLVPTLTAFLARGVQRIFQITIGNEGVLAAKNLRDNKNILNNISLLTLSLSSLIMIFTVSFSAVKNIVSFCTDARFQVWMWAYQADRDLELVLRSVRGVTGTYGVLQATNTEIDGTRNVINLIHGIDTRRYQDYWDLKIPAALLGSLDEGRNILLSEVLKKKFDAKEGDVFALKLANGKKRYKVAGFFNSFRWGGNFAIVSDKYLKLDASTQFYGDIYLKTSDPPEKVVKLLKKKLARRHPWVSDLDQMKANDTKSSQQLLTLLESFALLILVAGIFGVLNNYIISFVERRRHLAIFRSVGMSRMQLIRMMLIESLTGGIISAVIGCAGGDASCSWFNT